MKRFGYNLILLALIIFFVIQPTSFAQQDPQDPGVADTLLFEGICYYLEGPPYSGKLKVPIVFFNDDDLGLIALTIPLVWSGPVILDSASYAGSKIEYMESKALEIDSLNSKVLLGGVAYYEAVPPGRGLLATLYFTILDTGYLEIDSTFYPPGNVLMFDNYGAMPWRPQFFKLQFDISPYTTSSGDVNQDGWVDIVDVVFLANYLFRSGPPPSCSCDCADVNCDRGVNLIDVVYLINYLFRGGEPPYCHAPAGTLLNYGSKSFHKASPIGSIPPDQDCMEYQYDGSSMLQLKHVNAGLIAVQKRSQPDSASQDPADWLPPE